MYKSKEFREWEGGGSLIPTELSDLQLQTREPSVDLSQVLRMSLGFCEYFFSFSECFGGFRECLWDSANVFGFLLQGYLAHKKPHPPRTLQ